MKILVFNAGRFHTPEGGSVRAKQLFVYPEKHQVTWVDPIYYRDTYLRETMTEKVFSNVTLVPGTLGSKNPVYQWVQRERHFKKAVEKSDADVAVFYNAWGTHAARKSLRKQGIPVVFDYTDLMHEFRKNPAEKKISRFATTRALKESDAVVATAHVLAEDARTFNPNTHYVPNGVDFDAFQGVAPQNLKPPSVGFVGGFGDWVDFSLFDFSLPAHFYFVGDGPSRRSLEEHAAGFDNVHLLGFKPPLEARRYMAAFDLCTIPFEKTALTDAVCPIKLFEYWASRKPVLCTPLEEVRRLDSGSVEFAKNRAEWSEKTLALLSDSKRRENMAEKGYQKSRKFDWKILAEKMDRVLEDVQANRAKRP